MYFIGNNNSTSRPFRDKGYFNNRLLLLGLATVCILTGLILFIWLTPLKSLTSRSLSAFDELHYAVVIDAGSSGSRVYLYAWPTHSGDPHELLNISPLTGNDGNPIYKKVSPGLSTFQDSPEESLAYMSPLLDFALQYIPSEKVHETPLFILATAGMRLVEKPKQQAILDQLRIGISLNYGFLFPEGNLEVISGKQEGIYQWLAINYVLGKFRHKDREEMVALDPNSNVAEGQNLVIRPHTVGAIDMGGASMQFAMEITSDLQMEGLSEEERSQVVEINLGCQEHDMEHTYRLFVTTFLGYGANEALARHRRDLILRQIKNGEEVLRGLDSKMRISDPCLPVDFEDNPEVKFDLDRYNLTEKVKNDLAKIERIYVKGRGDWTKCYENLKEFTDTGEKFAIPCDKKDSCHDSAIKVPARDSDDVLRDFYGFSEFWYTMEDVLRMGGPYFKSKFQHAAKKFCRVPWRTTMDGKKAGKFLKADNARLETQCFKSAWISVALHEGIGEVRLTSAPETVNGQVVHWTLGALLYRTRYIPLRAIESRARDSVHRGPYHSVWASGYLYSQYVVLLCLFLVLGAILVYLHRLKRYVRPSTLRKVPSLSFWVPSKDLRTVDVDHDEENHPFLHSTMISETEKQQRKKMFLA